MCGFLVVLEEDEEVNSGEKFEEVLETLAKRGPDGRGFLNEGKLWMGHTRLAIIDLSEEAKQPFTANNKNQLITFNGEIYNHNEIRSQLIKLGYEFRTKSDTETILALYDTFGIDGFSTLRGMYAFVIFDKKNKRIVVARDRFGEKPLYITKAPGKIIISSQLLTNFQVSGNNQINLDAIHDYLHYQYSGPQQTVLQDTYKFNRNTVEIYDLKGRILKTKKIYKSKATNQISSQGSLMKKLEQAINRNLVADVPICIAQSGGIDSVAVAIIASRSSSGAIHSFTVGYDGAYDFDERPWAAKLSKYLGNVQHDIEITEADFISDFDEYVLSLQDPIADPAGYSQFRLAKTVHDHGFKVCLTGLGADELFWGYPWLSNSLRLNGLSIPRESRSLLSYLNVNYIESFAYKIYKNHLDIFRELPKGMNPDDLKFTVGNKEFNSAFSLTSKYLKSGHQKDYNPFLMTKARVTENDLIPEQVKETLFDTWLACNSLSLIDQVSMYHSVEFRNPFLDSDLADLATQSDRIQLELNLLKASLKSEVSEMLPLEFLNRPKSGFNFPSNVWFRSLLREKSDNLLNGTLMQMELVKSKNLKKALSKIDTLSWQNINFLYKLLLLDIFLQRFDLNE
jgi:asparagine synthase (glutamine-hydrolysing)